MRMSQEDRYRSQIIESHLGLMRRRGRLKPSQVPEYRRELHKTLQDLEDEGMGCTPKKIGEREIEWLINERWAGLSVKTKRWKLTILNGLLKRHKNTVVTEMQLTYRATRGTRPYEQYDAPRGPVPQEASTC